MALKMLWINRIDILTNDKASRIKTFNTSHAFKCIYIDGKSVEDFGISSLLAMKTLQSCSKP